MKLAYQSEDVTLYEGDCRELLPTLEAGALIVDPPYGVDHSSNYGASWERTKIANDQDEALRDHLIEWAQDRGIPWAVFGNWKSSRPQSTKGILVWDKGPAFGMGDLSFPWKMSWEQIYIGGNGWRGRRGEAVLRGHMVLSWESKGRTHPHEKPVTLLSELIEKIPTVQTIVDPCCGSGTTLVAARKAGRHAIGCELDGRYVAIAIKRLEAARTPLFEPITPRDRAGELFGEGA